MTLSVGQWRGDDRTDGIVTTGTMAVVTLASFGRSQRPDTMGSQDTGGLVGVTFEGVVGRNVWTSRVSRDVASTRQSGSLREESVSRGTEGVGRP